MSLLFRVLTATACRSTHHKLALNALQHLRGPHTSDWQSVFLNYYGLYLQGAKAPDDEFKDFRNHVLHVRENYWGGAVGAAEEWYGSALAAMRSRNWATAVYNAGVLTHYYTDPIMPFHTGSSDAESVVHRAAEWSVTKSYDSLVETLSVLGGYPALEAPGRSDWLAEMVRDGARASNVHYEALIGHYNFAKGVVKPEEGFNPAGQGILARLLGHATVGVARILERMFAEAAVVPPHFDVTLPTIIATMNIPVNMVLKKIGDAKERAQVRAIYEELEATGKVVKNLPEENRVVRAAYAIEVTGKAARAPAASVASAKPEPSSVATAPISAALRSQAAAPVAERKPVAVKQIENKPIETLKIAETPKVAEAPKVAAVGASLKRTVLNSPPKEAEKETPQETEKGPPVVSRRREEKVDVPSAPRLHQVEDSDEEEAKVPATKPQPVVSQTTKPSAEKSSPPAKNQGSGRDERFYLEANDEVASAPSIGPKTAARLERHGIRTVADLLAADPAELAGELETKWITAQTIIDWQQQATLAIRIPELRGHDAQILVACDFRTAESLARSNPATVWAKVEKYSLTTECQRLLRSSSPPDEAEVRFWIASAQRARAA